MSKRAKALVRIAIALLLIAGLIVFYFIWQKRNNISMNLDNGILTLEIADFRTQIPMKEVISIECIDKPDLGQMVEGKENLSYSYGKWHNDAFGDYDLYIYVKPENVIVITTPDQTVVLNYADTDSTAQFAENLQKYLDSLTSGAE